MTHAVASHQYRSTQTSVRGVAGLGIPSSLGHLDRFCQTVPCVYGQWAGRQAGGHLGPSASCFLPGQTGLIFTVASESQADRALFLPLLWHLNLKSIGALTSLCWKWGLGGQVIYLPPFSACFRADHFYYGWRTKGETGNKIKGERFIVVCVQAHIIYVYTHVHIFVCPWCVSVCVCPWCLCVYM